ncbi:unnamed protein product [Citrullus colocynthis]|uniref:X8 domain-containing protein n=1 Tax=Citrullus colocynthis TaxID=252529 RepID=A0ABP0ZD54_9ROSI
MATLLSSHSFLLFFFLVGTSAVDGAYWCVARSDATYEALQAALDYACATGADCTPILLNGLCFLPNTIQAHASYAFNSFFQRKAMAPGSCDFAGSATIAQSDPSPSLSPSLCSFSVMDLVFIPLLLGKVIQRDVDVHCTIEHPFVGSSLSKPLDQSGRGPGSGEIQR